jgi:hypothetical protein
MSHAAERLLHQTVAHLRLKVSQLEDQVRLLDQENEDLIQQLKDAGLKARHPVLHADRLPPPLTTPDAAGIEAARTRMSAGEGRLYQELCGDREVMMALQTETRASVGWWLVDRRVWLVVTRDEVVAFAAGRTPLVQRVAFPHLHASLYNALTGMLVLAPDRGYRVGQFNTPPLEGRQVLAQIYSGMKSGNEGRA